MRLVAALTLLHRSKSLQKYVLKVDPGIRWLAVSLSLHLALAEALDKGHGRAVRQARFEKKGRRLRLMIECEAPAPLEKASMARCQERMTEQFGVPVETVFKEPEERRLSVDRD